MYINVGGAAVSPGLIPPSLPPMSRGDPCAFTLIEEYADAAAAAAHKTTPHYLQWRDAVAGLMDVPRSATAFEPCN